MASEAWIIDAVRTPRGRGKPDGALAPVHPQDLAAACLNALAARTRVKPADVDDVVLGCVTQTDEQGCNVSRAAVLAAGWPISVAGFSLNRFCASGLTAVNVAAWAVASGHEDLVVAGGVESMSRVPMGSDMGALSPALIERFPELTTQGLSAEMIAEKYEVGREKLDLFALDSQKKAARAIGEGRFKKSLVPVTVKAAGGSTRIVDADEHPRPTTTLEGLAKLKPSFKEGGRHTAGNSSGIVDGAAAVMIASPRRARELGLKPRARIVAAASAGSDPVLMLLGPIPSTKKALQRWGKGLEDVDLYEVNEAFAVVPLVCSRELALDVEKMNVNGGAIALGHPLGATGAMLVGTAIDELERAGKKNALVTLCIGYGMGVTTILERM
jgi:acetyl-CoA C-acetyltransferase